MGRSNVIVGIDKIEISFFLTFAEDGAIRLLTKQPALGRDERSMAMTLKVPRAIFRTPALSATVTINAENAPKTHIDTQAAASALKELFGAKVDVRVVSEGGE